MYRINNINETGGAGDWGTDKARARLQKDTPGQEITKGKKMKTFKDILNNIDESSTKEVIGESTRDYVDNLLPKALKKAGINCKVTKKQSYTSYDCGNGYEIVNNGVGIDVKKDIPRGKDVTYYSKPRLDYKKVVQQVSESVDIEEAMSEKDKAKRLAMIKKAVEKINRNNAEKAKKDALAMMKASGMFDEDVELQEIRKAPQIKHLNIYGSEISGLRSGGKYYMAMAIDMRGKLMYKVIDEFGSIETIDLKTFAKRFG